MDEKKFLENFAKILGSGAQEELDKIEQKRLKEEKLLKSFGAALSKTAKFEVKLEDESPAPRQIKLPANFIKKTATPKIVIETPLVDVLSFIEPVEETIEEKIAVTADSTGIANTDLSDFVSQAASFTTKYEKGKKKSSDEDTEQREIDKINSSLRKEIETIKKSISDFHRLLHLQSMKIAWGGGGSSGGGEVWLKKLDDVDYQSLKNAADGQVLTFDAASGKWIASDPTGGSGTGGGDGDAIGPRGYRGSQGINGFTGSSGLHGFSGSKGNIGFAGSTGFNGNDGVDGYTGSAGVGEAGYTGSIGAGYTGSKGESNTSRIINYNYVGDGSANTFTIEGGYIANSVVVFLNGVKQVVGYDVFIESGETVNFTDAPPVDFIIDIFGYQTNSIEGDGGGGGTGGNGYTGSQGNDGAYAALGYAGSKGDLGYAGSLGPQGYRGLPGYDGSQGFVGSHGLQGEKGDLGPQGEQGEQGPVGLQGEMGPVGNDGTRGAKGYTGSNGIDGYNGSQGIAGEFAGMGYTGSIGYTGSSSDRLTNNGYEVVLASTGQLNIPSADNAESDNARIQSTANIDILSELSLWTFGTDSVLTLPEHGKIIFNSANPEQYIEGTMGFHIHASDGVSIDVGSNTYSFGNDGIFTLPEGGDIQNSSGYSVITDLLHVNSNIIPNVNTTYSLGNSSMRWESLWVGSNSIIFADSNTSYPDQVLTVSNGIFNILQAGIASEAGLRVGNFTFVNNYILLSNSAQEIVIGSTNATAPVIFNRPINIVSGETGTVTFAADRSGRVKIIPPTIPAGDVGAFSIIGSANAAYQGVVNPGGMLHITGNDGVVSRITNDGFGTGAFPAYISRAGRGTANTPSAIQSGDIMSRYSTVGWGATNFPTGPAATNIEVYARENFTDTAGGTEYRIYTSPIGTNAKTLSLTINSNGIYSNNITSYSNISGNSATFSSNVYIGNAGVATKLIVSGGANDQILVSNGTTLNWTARHTDGSWTPVMIPATGSNVVFTVTNGTLTKAGPIVTAHFDITVSSKGTASGALKLGGLPYTSLTNGEYAGTVNMGRFENLNVADVIHFSGAIIANSNTADLWISRLNGQHIDNTTLLASDVKIGSRFIGTVIYNTEF